MPGLVDRARSSSEGRITSARAHLHGLLYVGCCTSCHIDNAFDIVSRLILPAPCGITLAVPVGGGTTTPAIGGWIRTQQDLLVETLKFDGQVLAIESVFENLA